MTHITPDRALIHFAHAIADEGSDLLRTSFRQKIPCQKKDDGSLVTPIDKVVEEKIRTRIRKTYPHHGIIGEEYPDEKPHAEWVWCIDPLDGTTAFLAGSPLFGLLIGLAHEGRPFYGIIDHPAQKERWHGGVGTPTSCSTSMPCIPRQTKKIRHALMHATTPHMFLPQHKTSFDRLQKQCLATRYGLDCYAYGLLISGFIDIVAEAPVVKASGALISDWQGRDLDVKSDGTVLACCNSELHNDILTQWQKKA